MVNRKVECPSCFFEWTSSDDIMEGEVITCPDCGVDLEVVAISEKELKLEKMDSSDEDWGE